MQDPILDKKGERELWLSENGLDENDIMERYDGTEFVMIENESDESGEYKEVELPPELQKLNNQF